MPREGLRRSTRVSTSAAPSRVASGLSDDSDLDLLIASDSEDEYVGDDGDAGGGSGSGSEMDVDDDEDGEPEDASEEDASDDQDMNKKGKGKGAAGRSVSVLGSKRKRTVVPRRTKAAPRKPRDPGRRSTAAARSNSTLNAFPDTYRDLLLNSGTTLVKKTENDKPMIQNFRAPPFPPGPVTPFITRLAHAPGKAVAEVNVTEDEPHGVHRREHMRDIAKRVAVVPPWDGWEGEGWAPEMCADPQAEEGPIRGWKWKQDVRLGLEDVGRISAQDVLPPNEGQAYLGDAMDIVLDMYDGQETARHELRQFSTVPIETTISKGFALATGAPAWGLDWCPYPDALAATHDFEQYVAVSTIPRSFPDPTTGSRCDPSERGAIQIWSVPFVDDANLPTASTGAKCEIVLCISGGPATDIKWMPLGAYDVDGDMPKLGIVAAVQLDGSTGMYAVPHPAALRAATSAEGPIFLKAEPLARFAVDDAACTCLEWLGGRRLATGLANGHVAIWDAVDAILHGDPLPDMYLTLALSSIRSISAGMCPPTDADGQLDYTGQAIFLAFGSYDGTTGFVDLREPGNVIELNRSRLPCMATAWSSQVGVPLYADVDYMVLLAQIRASIGPATYYLTPHRGPVWDIATSEYHTMVASAASDGSLLVSNCGMGFYRRKQGGMLFQRLYEIDYDETAQTYRMTHDFMAEATGLEEATSKANQKNNLTKSAGARAEAFPPTNGDVATVKTGAWRHNVGVHRVVWQASGLGRAAWIASAAACGLVRVENLRGKWLYQPK